MKNAGATVEFRNLYKHYGRTRALNCFNLSVEAGEFVTILGASGSGKTTVLNAIAGFISVDSGEICIAGTDISRLPSEQRNLGMVFQNYSLFPHMTVFENVCFPLRMRRTQRKQMEASAFNAIETVKLDGFQSRMPNELSGGQQQRVAIARAIASEPPVLLMDEPLGALDLKLRESLQFELKEIQRQIGSTVIYVTHDQKEAMAMSDRVVLLREGEIEQCAPPDQIYDRPRTRYVADFIGLTNLLSAEWHGKDEVTLKELGLTVSNPGWISESATSTKECWASLRPENIRRTVDNDVNPTFAATIDEVAFLGDIYEYASTVGKQQSGSGRKLYFRESRSANQPALRPGDEVTLSFVVDELVIIGS